MGKEEHLIPFKKGADPRRNVSGKNRSLISQYLKEFGQSKAIKYEIEITGTDGVRRTIKGELKGKGKNGSVNQVIATRLLAKAMSGDLKAIEAVMDRTEGKPKQSIELDNLFAGGTLKVGYGDQEAEQENED